MSRREGPRWSARQHALEADYWMQQAMALFDVARYEDGEMRLAWANAHAHVALALAATQPEPPAF